MLKKKISKIKAIVAELGFSRSIVIILNYIFSKNNGYIKYIKKIIIDENKEIIEKYKKEKTEDFRIIEKKIWFFWWQGKNNFPEIVKVCYNNLKKNIPSDYEVVLIDKDNYMNYVQLPEIIISKLNDNKITLTHFSDLLRQELLCKIGGMWIDSTVFCPNSISSDFLDKKEFWSIKLGSERINKKSYGQVISGCKFAGFILKNNINSVTMRFVRECNFNYWYNHNYLIEYFIQILIMQIGYELIPTIKNEIDNYEVSNINLYKLNDIMNEKFDLNIYNELKSNCNFFKLTWKTKYIKYKDNCSTFYNYIVQDNKE